MNKHINLIKKVSPNVFYPKYLRRIWDQICLIQTMDSKAPQLIIINKHLP